MRTPPAAAKGASNALDTAVRAGGDTTVSGLARAPGLTVPSSTATVTCSNASTPLPLPRPEDGAMTEGSRASLQTDLANALLRAARAANREMTRSLNHCPARL
ncbi:hypothetical protein GCM10022232_89680 [Streptomyces plumbiresistens]|uniref:Uncharacterized protein n=1 Tax=Streptomyces plumbiresistens TaxID=511811 RepID=A0ABP7TRC4_9ACTN